MGLTGILRIGQETDAYKCGAGNMVDSHRFNRDNGTMTLRNVYDSRFERERLLVVIATIVINVFAVSLLTFAPWSDWRTGAALNVIDNCLLVGVTIVRRDELLARFLLFGMVV